jgi:hypothetical protein
MTLQFRAAVMGEFVLFCQKSPDTIDLEMLTALITEFSGTSIRSTAVPEDVKSPKAKKTKKEKKAQESCDFCRMPEPNPDKCMSRSFGKGFGTQCTRKSKDGDYCGMHSKQLSEAGDPPFGRIDEPRRFMKRGDEHKECGWKHFKDDGNGIEDITNEAVGVGHVDVPSTPTQDDHLVDESSVVDPTLPAQEDENPEVDSNIAAPGPMPQAPEPAQESVAHEPALESVDPEPVQESVDPEPVQESVDPEPALESAVKESVAPEPALESAVKESVAPEPALESAVKESVAPEPAQEDEDPDVDPNIDAQGPMPPAQEDALEEALEESQADVQACDSDGSETEDESNEEAIRNGIYQGVPYVFDSTGDDCVVKLFNKKTYQLKDVGVYDEDNDEIEFGEYQATHDISITDEDQIQVQWTD